MLKHRASQSIHRAAGKANDPLATTLAVIMGISLVLALALVLYLVFGLVVYFAWNLGVVNAASAAGAAVSTIGYWPAVGIAAVIGILRSIFSRSGSTA